MRRVRAARDSGDTARCDRVSRAGAERGIAWRGGRGAAALWACAGRVHTGSSTSRGRGGCRCGTHREVLHGCWGCGRSWPAAGAADAMMRDAGSNAAMRSIVRRDTGESYEESARMAKASGIATPSREELARRIASAERTSNRSGRPADEDARGRREGRTHASGAQGGARGRSDRARWWR